MLIRESLYMTNILYMMKLILTILLALLLVFSVKAIDSNLFKEVQIPRAQSPASSDAGSLLQSLFGKLSSGSKESSLEDNTINERSIFKGLQQLNNIRRGSNILKEGNLIDIPYQALLPRKRTPLDIKFENAQKLFGQSNQISESKPLQKFIFGSNPQANGQNQENAKWQNPIFQEKENGDLMPFFNIFGKKRRRNKATESISQDRIQTLLIKKAPFLQRGRIVKMTQNHYKKGIFLNIQFEDQEKKMFDIIARYRPQNKRLEIVSIKQNNFLKKVQPQVEAAFEDKNLLVNTQEAQELIKKDDQIKQLNQKIKKLEALTKIFNQKQTAKQALQVKDQPKTDQKIQPQTSSDKKQEILKQTPNLVEEKKTQIQQKKEQKQISIDNVKEKEQKILTTEKAKNSNEQGSKSILSQ